jgi:hypothetical protein
MASSGPPKSRFPGWWRRHVYGAIIGVLSLVVAPFFVEVLKIMYARWLAKHEQFGARMSADVNQAVAAKRFDEAEVLLGALPKSIQMSKWCVKNRSS